MEFFNRTKSLITVDEAKKLLGAESTIWDESELNVLIATLDDLAKSFMNSAVKS